MTLTLELSRVIEVPLSVPAKPQLLSVTDMRAESWNQSVGDGVSWNVRELELLA